MMLAIRRLQLCKAHISDVVVNIRARSTSTDAAFAKMFQTATGKPRLFGRPYLPGSHVDSLPESLAEPSKNFPFILDKTSEAANSTSEDTSLSAKAFLRANLFKYGAVVLRGLALKTSTDFDAFGKALGLKSLPYVGGLGVRDSVEGIVMTASREPPPFTIEPHNEMSYLSSNWAKYIWFFCETPPAPGCGGESVLVMNKDLQRDLDPEISEKFRKLGIRYTQYLHSRTDDAYMSWQEVFQSENKDDVEQMLMAQGHNCEWSDDDALRYWYKTAAFQPHHTTGEEIWFNQAHMNASYFRANPAWEHLTNVPDDKMPFHTYYGDGSIIESEVINHVRAVVWKNAIGLQLRKGDVLFIDNMAVQHGRLGYVGDRRLLVSLSNDSL